MIKHGEQLLRLAMSAPVSLLSDIDVALLCKLQEDRAIPISLLALMAKRLAKPAVRPTHIGMAKVILAKKLTLINLPRRPMSHICF